VKEWITINGLKVAVVSKLDYFSDLAYKVIILDQYGDVSPLEAEGIVRYLYLEGWLERDDVFLEVVRN